MSSTIKEKLISDIRAVTMSFENNCFTSIALFDSLSHLDPQYSELSEDAAFRTLIKRLGRREDIFGTISVDEHGEVMLRAIDAEQGEVRLEEVA